MNTPAQRAIKAAAGLMANAKTTSLVCAMASWGRGYLHGLQMADAITVETYLASVDEVNALERELCTQMDAARLEYLKANA